MKSFSGYFSATEGLKYDYGVLNDRFPNDKVIYEDPNNVLLLEGCVLNLDELKTKHACADAASLYLKLWNTLGENLVCELHGAYVIAVYDKNAKRLFVANDLLSKRALYVCRGDGFFAFSERFFDLAELLSARGVKLTPDPLGVAMMLQDGFLWEDVTWAKEIQYVGSYRYAAADEKGSELKRLAQPDIAMPSDYDAKLAAFNERFERAVKEQFAKNEQAGYRQLATLSGGMDSRSVYLTGSKLGYSGATCVTYAESGTVDYKVAQRIAADHRSPFFFHPIDNAFFCLMPDELCAANDCMMYYMGATGAYETLHALDNREFGIIHTGSLGGETMGDTNLSAQLQPKVNPFSDEELKARYESYLDERSDLYDVDVDRNRRACQNFFRMAQDRFEAFSPFMHEEVYDFIKLIPQELRFDRRFYRDWMMKYIPNDYISTLTMGKVNSGKAEFYARKVGHKLQQLASGKSEYEMNPFAYWYSHDAVLHESFDKLYREAMSACEPFAPQTLKKYALEHKGGDLHSQGRAITAEKALLWMSSAQKQK